MDPATGSRTYSSHLRFPSKRRTTEGQIYPCGYGGAARSTSSMDTRRSEPTSGTPRPVEVRDGEASRSTLGARLLGLA